MNVERYAPRHQKKWEHRPDGTIMAEIYTVQGIVEVFSFPGDDRHRPFTSFKMWIHPHVYHRTLTRHYHSRWIQRIAHEFAWCCQMLHDGHDPGCHRGGVGRNFR